MVSKASEDLPEPERPVNTTSRSRGISRSTFLRLCSRAPRMVIARMAEPALFWRFALITSSITGVPDALAAPCWGAHRRKAGDRTPVWVRLEHRKNAGGFPVLLASHQRFVAPGVVGRGCNAQGHSRVNKKAGARPAFRIQSEISVVNEGQPPHRLGCLN